MVKKNYVPERGDLVWLSLDPTRGHEQKGRRPALVITPKAYNQKSGLCLACPITSTVRGYPFEVEIRTSKVAGAILSDQIRAIAWKERKAEYAGRAPGITLGEVVEKLAVLIE